MVESIQKILFFFLCMALTGCAKPNPSNITAENRAGEEEPIILTYGYIDAYSFQDLDPSINERIVSFNKSQDDYFIEAVKYGEDSYSDGLNALNADISAGKGPDIIEIKDQKLLYQLGQKNVVEDLYTYIDGEMGPHREEFVENVLPYFESDGKLYGIVPFFSIYSLIGNSDYITSGQIDFEQFKKMYEENKSSGEMIVCNNLWRETALDFCVLSSLDKFVDLKNQKCDFVNADFKELLQFTAELDAMPAGGADWVKDALSVQEGKVCLYQDGPISGFGCYTHYRELSGNTGILLGYPSVNGGKITITTNFPFLTINKECRNKNAAWSFLCTFFAETYLTNDSNTGTQKGFPITKQGFEGMAKREMAAYDQGEETATSVSGLTITYPIYTTTEEEIENIKEAISKAEKPEDYGEINDIIWEEIQNYWSGDKTVEEVMEVMQNRSQLYLNEK